MKAKRLFYFALILATGACLRLYKLGAHDLWYDESISAYWASFIKDALAIREYGTLPPFYYLLLHFWLKIFPGNEFWLRLPSVLFGVAAIFALYKVCNLFFSRRVAIVAGFIIAVSPIHIWYAQEVRPYSLTPLFSILIVYFFIKALEENRNLYWIGLLFLNFTGFFTSYFMGVFVVGELCVLCLKRYRRYFLKWLGLHSVFGLAVCLIFFPWVATFFLQCVTLIRDGFWVQRPTIGSLFITFNNFNIGYTAARITYVFSFIIFFILFIYGSWHGYKRFKDRCGALFLLLAGSVLFAFLFSFLLPIYIDRQLIALSPLYYIFIAIGIEGFRPRSLKSVPLVCIFLLMGFSLNNYYRDKLTLPVLYHQGAYIKKPFKPVLQYIVKNFNLENDVVVFANPGLDFPLQYYYRDSATPSFFLEKSYYFYISGPQDEYWKRHFTRYRYRQRAIDLRTADMSIFKDKKVLIISGSWSRDGTMDENSRAVNNWMEERFKRISEKEFDGIFVSLYE